MYARKLTHVYPWFPILFPDVLKRKRHGPSAVPGLFKKIVAACCSISNDLKGPRLEWQRFFQHTHVQDILQCAKEDSPHNICVAPFTSNSWDPCGSFIHQTVSCWGGCAATMQVWLFTLPIPPLGAVIVQQASSCFLIFQDEFLKIFSFLCTKNVLSDVNSVNSILPAWTTGARDGLAKWLPSWWQPLR